MLIINSCFPHSSLKLNSKWIYDNNVDSMNVYIHKNNLFNGIIIKDHIDTDSAEYIGKAKRKYLVKPKKYPSPKY